jgi:hypothetical protein
MLIALALAAATMALPPVTLAVRVAPGIPEKAVAIALNEAAAIWRVPGVALVWEISRAGAAASPAHGPCVQMEVLFENEPGVTGIDPRPLGWIMFYGLDDPGREIHLSYGNAMTLMETWYGMTLATQMTLYERDILLGRALGRALAHELGHYLFRSKDHTKDGLMQARKRASDFFSPYPSRFQVDAALKSLLASRLILSPGRPSTTQD